MTRGGKFPPPPPTICTPVLHSLPHAIPNKNIKEAFIPCEFKCNVNYIKYIVVIKGGRTAMKNKTNSTTMLITPKKFHCISTLHQKKIIKSLVHSKSQKPLMFLKILDHFIHSFLEFLCG